MTNKFHNDSHGKSSFRITWLMIIRSYEFTNSFKKEQSALTMGTKANCFPVNNNFSQKQNSSVWSGTISFFFFFSRKKIHPSHPIYLALLLSERNLSWTASLTSSICLVFDLFKTCQSYLLFYCLIYSYFYPPPFSLKCCNFSWDDFLFRLTLFFDWENGFFSPFRRKSRKPDVCLLPNSYANWSRGRTRDSSTCNRRLIVNY